jgi:hypothetical protein
MIVLLIVQTTVVRSGEGVRDELLCGTAAERLVTHRRPQTDPSSPPFAKKGLRLPSNGSENCRLG